MDLALTPELVEIQERSRRFCDEYLLPVELAVRAGRTACRPRRSTGCGRGVLDARLHAVNMPARVGRPGLHAGSSR